MQNCFRVCFRFIFVCFGFTLSCFVLWLPFTGLYRANSPGLREKEKRNGIIPMGLCYGADSQALTVVRREPAGRYPLPCGEPEGH